MSNGVLSCRSASRAHSCVVVKYNVARVCFGACIIQPGCAASPPWNQRGKPSVESTQPSGAWHQQVRGINALWWGARSTAQWLYNEHTGGYSAHALRVAVGDKDFFTALRTWTTQRRGGNGSHPHHQPEYQQISRDSQQVGRLGDAEPVLGVPSRDVGAKERVRIQRMQVSEATLNRLVGVYRTRPG